jgi:hypothetical protein
MRKFLKTVIAAAAFSGAVAAVASPASAQGFSFGFGSGGITFSYSSGGFCDSWGCPPRFWDMPVYYGPVFFRGDWYQGPVYYRIRFGVREYWVRGGWHRDEWRGPRPVWARNFRVGPALGFEYYDRNGFGLRDEWRRQYYGPNWNQGFGPRFGNAPGRGPNFNGSNLNNNRLGGPGGYQDNNGDFRDDRTGRPLEDVLNNGPGRGNAFNPGVGNRRDMQQPDNNPGQFPNGQGRGPRGNFQQQGQVQQPPPAIQNPAAASRGGIGQRDPRADDMEQMRSRFRNNNNN